MVFDNYSINIKIFPATVIALGVAGFAWGQALPPTGQVGHDTMPSLPSRDKSLIIAPVSNVGGANPNIATASVVVKAFNFMGNSSISTEELQAVVALSLNQELDLAGLGKVADSVSRHYRSKGYAVARAYLPPQTIADGTVKINILEGRFGAVNLNNSSAIRHEHLAQVLSNNLCDISNGKDCVGKLIEDKGLERSILLLKDLPGVAAAASLKPGVFVGTSELDVDVKSARSTTHYVGADNFGSPSTGTTRLNASIDLSNLRNIGDQLSLGIATTTVTQTKTGSANYSFPIGYRGQRVGLAYSRNQFKLGAGFSATQSNGISNAASVFTQYPLVRGINQSLYLRASAEIRGATNNVDSLSVSYKSNANVSRIGISGDNVDGFGGGGYTVYGLTFSQGYIGSNDAADTGPSGAHSAGRFGKVAYNIARQQTISGPLTLYAALNGQQANKNLDGSEQTGLGGPFSVRGYAGESGGSSGANSTLELRYTAPIQLGSSTSSFTSALFVDRGWVQYYQTPIAAGAQNTRALSSYGLTFTLQSQAKTPTSVGAANYFLRVMLGMHSMGADQKSTVEPESKGKVWIQGGITF